MGMILDYRERGKALQGNFFTTFLWNVAGADVPLLNMCPTDQAKYTALGGAIVLCSILVGYCSAYFIYSLATNVVLSISCGFLIALMFFFIYRMAISTMYSDGKSSVSAQEIKSAIPSVVLSIAVGVFVSTTIEMAIFEGQIESELDKECSEHVASVIGEEMISMEASEENFQKLIDELSVQISNEETDPIKNKVLVGRDLRYQALKFEQDKDSLASKLAALKQANESKIEKLQQVERMKYLQNVDYAKRVEAMYNVSSWAVNPTLGFIRMFISLIFIVILISPIVSKMMFEDGAYEELVIKMSDEIKAEVAAMSDSFTIDNQLTQD